MYVARIKISGSQSDDSVELDLDTAKTDLIDINHLSILLARYGVDLEVLEYVYKEDLPKYCGALRSAKSGLELEKALKSKCGSPPFPYEGCSQHLKINI